MAATVVGGSALAHRLTSLHRSAADANSIALLSARPDGPQFNLLSLLVAMRYDTARAARKALEAKMSGPHPLPESSEPTGASVSTEGVELVCAWHSLHEVYNASLFRFLCDATMTPRWDAVAEMTARRRRMQLSLSLPDFAADIDFTTEALNALPKSGISGCVDFAYHGGDRPRDFNEWAFTQQLVGIERIYVADQLRYRDQVRDQVSRGFAHFTHDYPHRYVTRGARDGPAPPTTYAMFYQTTSAYNMLCLHEHWYDDWVLVSYSTDEFLTFLGDVEAPTTEQPKQLVGSVISRFWEKLGAPAERQIGGWARRSPQHQFCTSMLCMNRPFYGPAQMNTDEVKGWTLPGASPVTAPRLHYGSENKLSIERFTRRFRVLPPKGSVRKCFVHPDWRLGSKVKAHGFVMQSCPLFGGIAACTLGWPRLRSLCLEMCGVWGNETLTLNATCRGFSNGGMIVRNMELAHFRVAPGDNQVRGYEEKHWLSSLASPVRSLFLKLERKTGGRHRREHHNISAGKRSNT